jgi:hypothetical protein
VTVVAVGRTGTPRKGWDNFDVLTSSGVRVEVKASGYLQSWPQARLSRLGFGRVAARSWDENANEFGAEPEVRADVFVFAVQRCEDPNAYDALDVDQWDFYVVAAEHVRACGYKTVSIAWVRRYATPVAFSALAETIESVASAMRPSAAPPV